jgi:hypothetical protein
MTSSKSKAKYVNRWVIYPAAIVLAARISGSDGADPSRVLYVGGTSANNPCGFGGTGGGKPSSALTIRSFSDMQSFRVGVEWGNQLCAGKAVLDPIPIVLYLF